MTTVFSMPPCSPCRIVSQTAQSMALVGQKVTSFIFLSIGQATSKCVAVTTSLVKTADGAKNISLLALSVIEFAALKGASVTRFDGLVASLKTFNDVITARSIIGRVDEVTSGRAFGNVVKLARTISFLVYDVFGTLKFAEKIELVSKGTANSLAFKLIGDTAEVARPFFGYMGCGFSILESSLAIQQKGFTVDSCFSVLISTSRVIGFATPKGTLMSVATGATTAALCIARSLIVSQ